MTANNYCTVTLWRADADEPVWTVRATKEREARYFGGKLYYGAVAVAFAADGKRVFCAWAAGVAEIDREKGTLLRVTKFPKLVASDGDPGPWVAFIPGTDECVYFGEDERLVRFDFKAGKVHDTFNVHVPKVYGAYVAVSPDGKRVLTYGGGQQGRHMAEWDLSTGGRCRLFDEDNPGYKRAGYTPDGTGVWMNTLLFDQQTGARVKLPGALAEYNGWLWPSPDGKHALALPLGARKRERLDVIRVSDGKIVREFSSEGVWYARRTPWNPDDDYLVSNPGLAVFTPDGKTVVLTGVLEGKAALGFFDLETGKHLRTIRYDP